MDLDAKIPSKGIIETLSDQIAELESLEATGVANFDTCEMLVEDQQCNGMAAHIPEASGQRTSIEVAFAPKPT